jgi:uncharacterized protein YdaU (DUF1376 family)
MRIDPLIEKRTDPSCRGFFQGSILGLKTMHYYQFNIGDYASHTRHLNVVEDCAYRRLLDFYYLHEKPIKHHDIARQINMREHEQEVLSVLNEFFLSTDDGFVSPRANKEIEHFHSKIEQASKAGKASAERRFNGRSTDVQPTNNHKPITINQEPNIDICPPSGEPEEKTGLPKCCHQEVIDLYHQKLPTLRKIEVWNDARKGYLRQRWRDVSQELSLEKPIQTEDVLSWWSDFFTHIGQSKFLTGRVNDKSGRTFAADLEWILKPSNFAKIIEGKYHGI